MILHLDGLLLFKLFYFFILYNHPQFMIRRGLRCDQSVKSLKTRNTSSISYVVWLALI